MTNEHTDCVIVGAGITGTTISARLAKMSLRSIVIEKTSLEVVKPGESLNYRAVHYLEELDNALLSHQNCLPFFNREAIWDNHQILNAHSYKKSASVDRMLLEKDLVSLSTSLGTTFYFDTKLSKIQFENDFWLLEATSEKKQLSIKCRLLIIATGRFHLKFINDSKRHLIDKLICHSAIISESLPYRNKKLQIEAMCDGWIYSNGLPNRRRVLSFFTDNDIYPKMSVTSFAKLIEQSVLLHGIDISTINEVNVFDARSYWSTIHSGIGFISIGDACYSIDPLSGLGITKNLEMVDFVVTNINKFLNYDLQVNFEYMHFNLQNFERFKERRTVEYSKIKKWNSLFWTRRSV